MLLQKLREYSERLDLPPTLYSELPVRYVIDLDAEGRFLGITDTSDPATPRTKRGSLRLVPEVQRSVGVKPLLLCDKADYVLGFEAEGSKPERVRQCNEAFVSLTSRCAAVTEEPAVAAVLSFIESQPLERIALPADFVPGDRITFAVDGVFPIALPSVQAFWARVNDPALSNNAPVHQCVICGQQQPVLERLQGKIKGVPGGQTSGTSIISANAEAFESYGLEASLIAPTCADCAERFTKAMNDLLGDRRSRTSLAGAAFIYWTREYSDFDLLSFIVEPEADAVGVLLQSVFKGGPTAPVDPTRLYATVLSGSGGRAVVRDWIDTTVGDVERDLARWFQRQAVVDINGEAPRPLGLAALAGATVRSLADVSTPTMRALMRGALTGTALPYDLLYQAVRRNRAEQAVTRPRAALIKLVLCSQQGDSPLEESMVELDPNNPNPAYRCGRLLAVLERVQQLAIPGVNATIVDRYFGTASSAPATVFPRLVRGAQPHLAKIERDRRGAYFALQGRIEEILGGLPVEKVGALYTGFPVTLSLQDQGLFSLGYYHQRAHDRAESRAAAERRRAGLATPDDDTADDVELQA